MGNKGFLGFSAPSVDIEPLKYSLYFNGTTSKVSTSNNMWAGRHCVCFWTKIIPKAAGQNPMLISKHSYYATDTYDFPFNINLNYQGTLVNSTIDAGGDWSGDSNLTGVTIPNVWQHITSSYDGITHRVYVNGVQTAYFAINCNVSPGSRRWAFGAPSYENGGGVNLGWFNGYMCDIRIYGNAKTVTEINNIKDGLVDYIGLSHWYKFNEGTGTIAYDYTGNCDGTIANGTWSKDTPRGN